MEQLRQNLDGTDSAEETNKKISDSVDSERGQIFSENPYEKLFAQNEDMAAWLVVDGTVIDYPVMQTMEDEIYYLKRDFDGNEDEAGCLILDTDSDLYAGGTTNLIIHGHNMKAGTMFGSLDEYRNEDFYSEHKYMELYTETERRCYEVMAVFYSQVYYTTDQVFKYYQFFQAQDEEGFQDFYENVKKMSLYDTGVTAELGDCFLTLSTCTYHVEDGRFVVVAKEIRRTEAYRDGCVRRIGTRSL
ncbi:class B sortase [uncultured Acetatifactor sp.]|uniref:class B sortase n=1 Tax=uncultured Acetatifactor sp. TaxID=1671927 RepID=UPI00260B3DB3|nr:class B sortase [uncultured Acetatifactor sp.]